MQSDSSVASLPIASTAPAAALALADERPFADPLASIAARTSHGLATSLSPLPDSPALRTRIRKFQQRFARLHLEPIVARALGNAVSETDRAIALQHYRDFLCLLNLYPELSLSPTSRLDEVWHAHILDTRRYRRDCCILFGRFVDHEPSMEANEFARHRHRVTFTQMRQLYHHHFHIDPDTALEHLRGTAETNRVGECTGGACGRVVA